MTTTSQDAKSYLANKNIPALFESLMTGLMYNRPTDHISYLQECLGMIKQEGLESVRWNAFIQLEASKSKSPLPPIPTSSVGKTPSEGVTPDETGYSDEPLEAKEAPTQMKRTAPLPPIGQTTQQANTSIYNIPQCPIMFVMGGPGSGKGTQIKRLLQRYEGWVFLSMGNLLKKEIAGEGSSSDKWTEILNLVNNGELAPQDVALDVLGNAMAQNQSATGLIVEGFPRSMPQVDLYNQKIGRVDLVIMIDCEEGVCTKRLLDRMKDGGQSQSSLTRIASRIDRFKQTLPVAKYFDDLQKVAVIEGDKKADSVFYDLCSVFEHVFYNPSIPVPLGTFKGTVDFRGGSIKFPKPPPLQRPSSPGKRPRSRGKSSGARPISGMEKVQRIEISVKDTGRCAGIPECPIFFLMGGPGSGKGTHAARLVERYPGFVHLSMGDILRRNISEKGSAEDKWSMVSSLVQKGEMAPQNVTADLLIESLRNHPSATAFVIEGYPRTKEQVEQFYTIVGGLNMAVLLDCDEYYMHQRLTERQQKQERIDDNVHAINKRISFFKYNTLPVAHHFDVLGKLVVVNGDRDVEEVFYELANLFDYIYKGAQQSSGKPVVEEVIEPQVQPDVAPVLGDKGNPDKVKEIDGLDESVDCWLDVETYQQAQGLYWDDAFIDLCPWLEQRAAANMSDWLQGARRVKVSYTPQEYYRESRIPIERMPSVPREEIIKMLEKTVSFEIGSCASSYSSMSSRAKRSSVHVDMSRAGALKLVGARSSHLSVPYSPLHATLSDQDLEHPDCDSTVSVNLRKSRSSQINVEHDYEVSGCRSDDEIYEKKRVVTNVQSRPSHLHHSHYESSREDLQTMSRQIARITSAIASSGSVATSTKATPPSQSASAMLSRKPTKSNQAGRSGSGNRIGQFSLHATLSNEKCTSRDLESMQPSSYILRSFHSDGFIKLPDEEHAREALHEVTSKYSDQVIIDILHQHDGSVHDHRPTHMHDEDEETRLVRLLQQEKSKIPFSMSMGAMQLYEEHFAQNIVKMKTVEGQQKNSSRPLFQTFRIGDECGDMDSEKFYSCIRKHYNRVFQGSEDKNCKKSVMKIQDVISVVSFASVEREVFVPTFGIQLIETPKTLYIIQAERPQPALRDVKLDTGINMENFQLPDMIHILPDHNSASFTVVGVGLKSDKEKENLDMKDISDRTVVFVLGGPGSGKGTQCKKIAAQYGFCHLSSGDLLRSEVESGSELGKELVKIMESGALVPIETVLTLLKKAMIRNSTAKGFLIDGYPREVEQGKLFEQEIKPCDIVLSFDVSDETLVARLLKRAETSGRADDNEETIKKRLATFHEKTQPLIDHYTAEGKTKSIPSEGTVEEIFGEVEKLFESLGIKGIDTSVLKDHDIFFCLGGSGSGKSTQCLKINKQYGITHISTGDLLRAEMDSGSSRGRKLKEIMGKGDLVPIDAVIELLKEEMCAKASGCKGFIIDGFPREVDQALRFEEEVKPAKTVLFFDLSEDTMKQRITERAKEGGRLDDNEATFERKMTNFTNLTKPAVDHFMKQDRVITINAEGTVDDVFTEVQKQLDGQL